MERTLHASHTQINGVMMPLLICQRWEITIDKKNIRRFLFNTMAELKQTKAVQCLSRRLLPRQQEGSFHCLVELLSRSFLAERSTKSKILLQSSLLLSAWDGQSYNPEPASVSSVSALFVGASWHSGLLVPRPRAHPATLVGAAVSSPFVSGCRTKYRTDT